VVVALPANGSIETRLGKMMIALHGRLA